MADDSWRVSNGLLYTIQFEPVLDDKLVERMARAAVLDPLFDLTQEDEYAGFVEALKRTDVRLTDEIPLPPQQSLSENSYRDFLRRVVERMDAMRPWPELPFRRVPVEQWADVQGAKLVARIHMWYIGVQNQLQKGFEHLGDRKILRLRLRSGLEVALVAPWWTGSDDVALLSRDPERGASEVLAEFLEATGFQRNEVEVP